MSLITVVWPDDGDRATGACSNECSPYIPDNRSRSRKSWAAKCLSRAEPFFYLSRSRKIFELSRSSR